MTTPLQLASWWLVAILGTLMCWVGYFRGDFALVVVGGVMAGYYGFRIFTELVSR